MNNLAQNYPLDFALIPKLTAISANWCESLRQTNRYRYRLLRRIARLTLGLAIVQAGFDPAISDLSSLLDDQLLFLAHVSKDQLSGTLLDLEDVLVCQSIGAYLRHKLSFSNWRGN